MKKERDKRKEVKKNVENERRFLVKREEIPEELRRKLSQAPIDVIEQGYVPRSRVRIRKITNINGTSYVATEKSTSPHGPVSRFQNEWTLSQEEFEELWRLTENRRIKKDRRRVDVDGVTVEVDEFRARDVNGMWVEMGIKGKLLAEVEFEDYESAVAFDQGTIPWLGRDVTLDISSGKIAVGQPIPES